MNKELMKELVDALMDKIGQKASKSINTANIERSSTGIVVAVLDNSAQVDLGYLTTDYIPNLSGDSLSRGSVVKVFYEKSDMRNAYIGVRFASKEATN